MLYAALQGDDPAAAHPDFYLYFYRHPAMKQEPFVRAFLILSGWLGTSLRSGVWTFYEVTPVQDMLDAAGYFRENGAAEIAEMLQKGIHDYQDPKYQADFDYPAEWLREAEETDGWINAHRTQIEQYLTDELRRNRQIIEKYDPAGESQRM